MMTHTATIRNMALSLAELGFPQLSVRTNPATPNSPTASHQLLRCIGRAGKIIAVGKDVRIVSVEFTNPAFTSTFTDDGEI
jgi:hypothetical protein